MPARRKPVTSGYGAQATPGNDDEPSQGRVLRARTTKIMESGGPGVNPQASVQRPSPPKQARSIPLRCYLCPKQPTFSDVSHLLTHISSKSHLACRFKLELLKKGDDDAKFKLDNYDQWYTVNAIEDLLDSRMAAKKEKKPSTKTKAATTGMKRSLSESTSQVDTPAAPEDERKQRQPRLHHWKTSSGRASLHLHEARDDLIEEDSVDAASEAQDGLISNGIGRRLRSSGRQKELTDPEILQSDPIPENANEKVLKLKGTVYEGMDLFDAATPEQKRFRNQKKDPSVLVGMKATSRSIQHDKFVWDESFESVTRVRDIYASPSIDGFSDVEDKEVKKKAKKAKTNNEHVRQTRSATKAAQRGYGEASQDEEQDFKPESSPELEDMDDSSINHGSSADDASDDVFRPRNISGLPGNDEQGQDNFELPHRWAMQGRNPNMPVFSPVDQIKQPIPGYPPGMHSYTRQPYIAYGAQPSAGGLHQFDYRLDLNTAGTNPIHPQSHYGGLPGAYGPSNYGQQGSGLNGFQPVTDMSAYAMFVAHGCVTGRPRTDNVAASDV